jgi:hypothetical protein
MIPMQIQFALFDGGLHTEPRIGDIGQGGILITTKSTVWAYLAFTDRLIVD